MKYSRYERQRRKETAERVKEIESAWARSVPADVAAEFASGVAAAIARGPEPKKPDMAPGTAPRPPRPGREPKPVADTNTRSRRGR
jgi:hypothetical protein